MSDSSSIVIPDSNHSVSTDTEESFLMRQLNKSQLFNNSNSNSNTSSSGSSNARRQRRSFFRESYIDETGANKSFSVYQDVINETSDESRDVDLSGLSSLDLKLVGNNSILGELDGNKTISRSGSILKDVDTKRNRSIKRNDSKRFSQKSSPTEQFMIPNSSQNISSQNLNSSHISSQNLSSFSDISLLQQRLNNSSYDQLQAARIPTPDHPAPGPPTTQLQSIQQPVENLEHEEGDDGEIPRIYSAYAHTQKPHENHENKSTFVHPGQSASQRSLLNLKQPTKKQSQSTLSSSNKSINSTRRSIMEYEETRKRSPGLPNLLIHHSNSNHSHSSSGGEGEVKIQNVHGVARRGLGFSIVGIVPSIHSPVSASEQKQQPFSNDDMGFDNSNQRRRDIELQDFKKQQLQQQSGSKFKKQSGSNHYQDYGKEKYPRDSSDSGDSYNYYHDDELLQKIHHYRHERPHTRSNNSDTIAWLVFCTSFLVPPLFFFLGFGVLDQFIGHTSPYIKRFSLIMGFVILLISLACIGIGFGVGLTSI